MTRQNLFRWIVITALALPQTSCIGQFNLMPLSIVVQIEFTEFHENVTASWSGSMTSTTYQGQFTGAQITASGTTQALGDVVPPQFVEFPAVGNLHGGTWDVSVELFEDGVLFLPITCNSVDLGDIGLRNGGTYFVRIIEDSNSCISASGSLDPPTPPVRDVEATSIAVPTNINIGEVVTVSVGIANNSEIAENIGVALVAMPPGGGLGIVIDDTSRVVGVAATDTVDFSWDTACLAPAGSYLITATVTAPNDTVMNNTASQATQFIADRELSLVNLTPPATVSVTTVGGNEFTAQLINGDSVAEPGVILQFNDASANPPGTIQWLGPPPPFDLACGETRDLEFYYFPVLDGATHDLSLAITNAIPGDDPADNTQAVTVIVVP